jgi:hypothetical protein
MHAVVYCYHGKTGMEIAFTREAMPAFGKNFVFRAFDVSYHDKYYQKGVSS